MNSPNPSIFVDTESVVELYCAQDPLATEMLKMPAGDVTKVTSRPEMSSNDSVLGTKDELYQFGDSLSKEFVSPISLDGSYSASSSQRTPAVSADFSSDASVVGFPVEQVGACARKDTHGKQNERMSIEMDRMEGNKADANSTSMLCNGPTTAHLVEPATPTASSTIVERNYIKRTRMSIENPFKIRNTRTLNLGELAEALKLQATELHIECFDLQRLDLFSKNMFFGVIFTSGKVKDEWEELDRTEIVPASNSPRFVKAVRLPSANESDRTTVYRLRIFHGKQKFQDLASSEFFAESTFAISDILGETSLSIRRPLSSPRSGRKKGDAILSLDLIQQVDRDELIIFDFGFTEFAPLSNRLCFVIARALRKGRFAPVYRSETQSKQVLCKFEDACLVSQHLHGGDETRLFRLEVYQHHANGEMALLGYVQTSLEKLKTMEPGSALYWWPALNGLSFAHVKVVSRKVEDQRCWFVLRMTG
jgi:hypothetical protein